MATALIIIDMQKGFFNPKHLVYKADILIDNINKLINLARAERVKVIFIQHNGGKNHPLEENTEGWQLIDSINIAPDDIKITKSDTDAFLHTSLNEYLDKCGITKLVIAGLQTEYCIDTTCRRAYSLGYEVTLVSDAHSTYDNQSISAPQIIAHHNALIGNLFGSVIPTHQISFYSKKLLNSSA